MGKNLTELCKTNNNDWERSNSGNDFTFASKSRDLKFFINLVQDLLVVSKYCMDKGILYISSSDEYGVHVEKLEKVKNYLPKDILEHALKTAKEKYKQDFGQEFKVF